MIDTFQDGIWPPHESFYLEAMLHCSESLRAANDIADALEAKSGCSPSSQEWQDHARTIVNSVQVFIVQAAAISRYFWPTRKKEPHLSRAARLRDGLGISDRSPLRNRDLRNRLEHFDEKLDEFCRDLVAGVIMPTYVGPMRAEPAVSTHLFRAYYTDVGVFEILGHRVEMQPVLNEVQTLHNLLVQCDEAGGRIPYKKKSWARVVLGRAPFPWPLSHWSGNNLAVIQISILTMSVGFPVLILRSIKDVTLLKIARSNKRAPRVVGRYFVRPR